MDESAPIAYNSRDPYYYDPKSKTEYWFGLPTHDFYDSAVWQSSLSQAVTQTRHRSIDNREILKAWERYPVQTIGRLPLTHPRRLEWEAQQPMPGFCTSCHNQGKVERSLALAPFVQYHCEQCLRRRLHDIYQTASLGTICVSINFTTGPAMGVPVKHAEIANASQVINVHFNRGELYLNDVRITRHTWSWNPIDARPPTNVLGSKTLDPRAWNLPWQLQIVGPPLKLPDRSNSGLAPLAYLYSGEFTGRIVNGRHVCEHIATGEVCRALDDRLRTDVRELCHGLVPDYYPGWAERRIEPGSQRVSTRFRYSEGPKPPVKIYIEALRYCVHCQNGVNYQALLERLWVSTALSHRGFMQMDRIRQLDLLRDNCMKNNADAKVPVKYQGDEPLEDIAEQSEGSNQRNNSPHDAWDYDDGYITQADDKY
jgi:hypothetical protein